MNFFRLTRLTEIVKTGSVSSTAKRSAIGVSVMGPLRGPLHMDILVNVGLIR